MIPDGRFLLLTLGIIGIIGAFAWLYKKAEEEQEYDNTDKW